MWEIFDEFFYAWAAPLMLILFLGAFVTMMLVLGFDPSPILSITVALTPIWLPLALFYVTFERWLEFVFLKFEMGQGRVTLRIKLPQEVTKSPEAMEYVLAQIHNVQSPDNYWQTYIDGKHPLVNSFELVSIRGEVRFYANVPRKKTKNALEAQLYAQYPGIEVVEEEIDYTAAVPYDPQRFDMMAFHMRKKKPDVYPIKTYIDCGLDKMPKEEEKIDPMAPMLEHLGKVQSTEMLWIQILAVPHVDRGLKRGSLTYQPTWEGRVKAEIDKIMNRDPETKGSTLEINEQPRLTTGERDTVTAMERNVDKYAYECAIRWMYICDKGKFNGDIINPTLRSFSAYDVQRRNGIGFAWRTDFDYNWFADPTGSRVKEYKRQELDYYKRREFWQRDYRKNMDRMYVMSVEELATMFHIPGSTVVTPTLSRIMSTRKEAPPNLPVGTPPQ